MDVEDIVNNLGGFGRYQLLVTFLAYFSILFSSQHVLQDSFINYTPPHRCFVPSCDNSNTTYDEPFVNFTTPCLKHDEWSKCTYYKPNSSEISDYSSKWVGRHESLIDRYVAGNRHESRIESANNNRMQSRTNQDSWQRKGSHLNTESRNEHAYSTVSDEECSAENFVDENTIDCDHGWIYEKDLFETSTTIEFDLVCDRAYFTTLTTSAYSLGMLIGSLAMGIVADRYGRKVSFLISVAIMLAGGLTGTFSVNSIMLVLARIVTGIGAIGVFQCSFILNLEIMPAQYRSPVMLMINAAFAAGETIVGFYAIFIRCWRDLQLTIVLPGVLLFSYYWLMPESIRWLNANGRQEEAKQLVKDAAKMNKIETPDLSVFDEDHPEKTEDLAKHRSTFDLLKTPNMRKRSLNMYFIWITVNMAYYGVSQNAVNIGGNIFFNYIVMMLIEIPAYVFVTLIFDRMGHKDTLVFTLLVAGISCVASGLLAKGSDTALVVLSMIGKFGGAAAFAAIYVYASEIFPTEYRSLGVGSCSLFGNLGVIVSPLVAALGKNSPELPLMILGVLSCISVISVLFLPETVGAALPDTLEESERFGSDQSIWYFTTFSLRKCKRESSSQKEKDSTTNEEDDKQDTVSRTTIVSVIEVSQ